MGWELLLAVVFVVLLVVLVINHFLDLVPVQVVQVCCVTTVQDLQVAELAFIIVLNAPQPAQDVRILVFTNADDFFVLLLEHVIIVVFLFLVHLALESHQLLIVGVVQLRQLHAVAVPEHVRIVRVLRLIL